MSKFFAQPYDMEAKGFYFLDVETFETKMVEARNAYGQKVEEFEIQFIDGDLINCQFADAYGINQANIASFLEHEASWDEWQKISFILAVGELGGGFDHLDCDPDTIDISIYQLDSFKKLAEQFVDEGLFGEIPPSLQYYVDYDAIARDLEMDYSEATVDNTTYIFRLD